MNPTPAFQTPPRELDVDTLEEFDDRVAALLARAPLAGEGARGGTRPGARSPGLGSRGGSMAGWHLQSLDLRDRSAVLERLDVSGAVLLGCDLAPGVEQDLRSRGALIFPALPGVPFDPYRGELYTSAELYAGIGDAEYEATLDARVYAWGHHRDGGTRSLNAALATTLHDHAIGSALDALLAGLAAPAAGKPDPRARADAGDGGRREFGRAEPGRADPGQRVVGVMGGHAAERGSTVFGEAALLGRRLARAGYLVATGGGPGAMEAANLGAYLSSASEAELDEAIATLAAAPSFRPSVTDWARAAARVLRKHPAGTANLGIPTWFYGHEPPNMFATHIAKYFANAIREDVLLSACTGGIVVLPGAAGTVQEIFQDACENYYGSAGTLTPVVLVGIEHWTRELPAWQLLSALAVDRDMAAAIHLVDTVGEAVDLLSARRAR
jgi:predicted Rossmann-fold nucleotide-binding protein